MENMKKQISEKQIDILHRDEDMHYKLLLLAELQGCYEKLLNVLVMAQKCDEKMMLESVEIIKKIASLLTYNTKFWSPKNITEFNRYKKRIEIIQRNELKKYIKHINRFIKKYS